MDIRFHDLPLLKRFRLMPNNDKPQENLSAVPSTLPAKKRKESRDFSILPSHSAAVTTTYFLPAKKRILAIQPFDIISLNVEFDPVSNDDDKPQRKIPDPHFKIQDKETQIENRSIDARGVEDQCLDSQSVSKKDKPTKLKPYSCHHCPNTGGALKQTTDGIF